MIISPTRTSGSDWHHDHMWQGPTIGVDLGADGARTMMLVYNLPRTDAIYQQLNGIAGAAYFVAGLA